MNQGSALSRRALLAGGASVTGVTLLAACGAGGAVAPAAGGSQKLSGSFDLWQPWPIEQPTHGGPIGWKQLMDGYNGKSTSKVNISTPAVGPGESFELKVQAAFAAGAPPDAFQASDDWLPIFAAKGFSAPLDDLIKRDKWDKNTIFSSALETMSWQGKYWGIMQHPDIVFMWYATGLMEENGLNTKSLPTNWTQLDELALKLTKRQGDSFDFVGFVPYTGPSWQIGFTQANGAKLVSDDDRKAQLDSAEVLEALEWGKSHVKRLGGMEVIDKWRVTVPPGDSQAPGTATSGADSFAQKKMGAINGGNWFADNIRRANKRLQQTLKFGVAPIPSGPHGAKDPSKNIYAGGILISAQKAGKNLDLAWDFFKYVASKDGGLNVQRNTSDVCANKEAARDPSIIDSPDTGTGRKDFLPFFDQGSGARDFKHPAAVDIRAEYNKVVNAFLKDQTGNLRDDMKEANRLAQQKIDEFFQQNPQAGK